LPGPIAGPTGPHEARQLGRRVPRRGGQDTRRGRAAKVEIGVREGIVDVNGGLQLLDPVHRDAIRVRQSRQSVEFLLVLKHRVRRCGKLAGRRFREADFVEDRGHESVPGLAPVAEVFDLARQ